MSLCSECMAYEECECRRNMDFNQEMKLGACSGFVPYKLIKKTTDVVTDGLKHDGGKPRLALVLPEIIEAVGAVMTHGAEKYGEGNYRKVEPARYRDALMRHICKWLKNPHGIDDDSGLPHLWHMACNVAFLLELDKPETDMEDFKRYGVMKNDRCGKIKGN